MKNLIVVLEKFPSAGIKLSGRVRAGKMSSLQKKIAELPTYDVVRLDPLKVMERIRLASMRLLGEVNTRNLKRFNGALQAAGYLIDETGNPEKKRTVQTEVLKISRRILQHLQQETRKGEKSQSLIRDIRSRFEFEHQLWKKKQAA